jgi:hypothetical protein
MIKRLVDIARANLNDFVGKRAGKETIDTQSETPFDFDTRAEVHLRGETSDPLSKYYANL